MRLTRDQQRAVDHNGHVALVACPGSGKTRTLVARLARTVDHIRGSTRKVACITYTNVAANEVESRLRELAIVDHEDYVEVSTIHAFCLSNVLHYFHWLLPEWREGYEVLPPDSEEYRQVARATAERHGLRGNVMEQFELLGREPDGSPAVAAPLTPTAAIEFWEALRARGYIDFANIVYLAYRLIAEHALVRRALAARFHSILVDEFQDTSALQVAILSLIAQERGTTFFLVGDPFQSVYGFAGAHPELFDSFADEIGATRDFQLSENWRSSTNIVGHAERLCPRMPPMTAVGRTARCVEEPQYVHAENPFVAITEQFLPWLRECGLSVGRAAVLAPWWVTLLHLGRQLREYGVPIIGPGARPYKRRHLIAPLAEELCAYCEEPSPERIPLIERELFWLIARVADVKDFGVFTYGGRCIVWRLIGLARELRDAHMGSGVEWLRAAGSGFSSVLQTAELVPRSCANELAESAEAMIAEMERNEVDTSNLTTADIGVFARRSESLNLLTMHGAKGTEFDAVAIIDMHDGRVPNYRADRAFGDERTRIVEEGRRLFYVAITRARRLLMYVTDRTDGRNRPSRFLRTDGLGIIA